MPTPPATPTRRLADRLLADAGAGGLDQLIADMRADDNSWHRIALEIRDKTSGEVEVTAETVRRWGAPAPTPTAA
jgi:hypothetical protein